MQDTTGWKSEHKISPFAIEQDEEVLVVKCCDKGCDICNPACDGFKPAPQELYKTSEGLDQCQQIQ